MEKFLPNLMGKTSPLTPSERVSNRARISAPNTPAPKRDTEERPVLARKGKGGKKKVGTGEVAMPGSGTEIAATPPKERSKPAILVEAKKDVEEPWVKVVGRKAKTITEKKAIEGGTTNETTKKVNKSPAKSSNAMAAAVGGGNKK